MLGGGCEGVEAEGGRTCDHGEEEEEGGGGCCLVLTTLLHELPPLPCEGVRGGGE